MRSIINLKTVKNYKFLIFLVLPVLVGLLYHGIRPLWLKRPVTSFPLTLKWQIDLGNSTYERPSYKAGWVVLPTSTIFGNYWYGIEANTGRIVWSQHTDRDTFRRCLSEEYLVVSGLSSLLVLKTPTGEIVWEENQGNFRGATCSETKVFNIGARGFMQAYDLSNGQQLWGGTEPQKNFNSLIYNPEVGVIIAKAEDFHIIDPNSGKLLSSFEEIPRLSAPNDRRWQRGAMYVIDQGQLFIGGTVLDANTGQVIHREDRYRTFYPPIVTADMIYISTHKAGVVALDRETYALDWTYQPTSTLTGIPIPSIAPIATLDGTGYGIFADATLRAFDLETGQELGYWQSGLLELWQGPNCQTLPPTLTCMLAFTVGWDTSRAGLITSENMLFVSFGDGKLYAFGK